MKVPGPDHPIAIAPHPGRVRVTYGGRVVAGSARALALWARGDPSLPARLNDLANEAHDYIC